MLESETTAAPEISSSRSESSEPPKRSQTYYYDDGSIVFLVSKRVDIIPQPITNLIGFQVERHLYRVHRYLFTRHSPVFRDMFCIPPESAAEGSSADKPITLEQVKATDFEHLLWMLYNE
jgi:hypothetical protein